MRERERQESQRERERDAESVGLWFCCSCGDTVFVLFYHLLEFL